VNILVRQALADHRLHHCTASVLEIFLDASRVR
jgi:hypothetical protein